MTKEEKLEFAKGLLQGANLEHAQINLVVEAGAMVCYTTNQTNDINHQNTYEHPNEAIMEYVDRLKPMVREEFVGTYDQLWSGILELEEVKLQVYNKGKQQDTIFNRNLIAQIIHQIAARVYLPSANTVNMAERLEPGKGANHSVRQRLGEVPDVEIKKSVEKYLNQFF